MDEIFSTDRCILLIYPPGASGKFLSNCLSMHSRFVYQHVNAIFNKTPIQRFARLMTLINENKMLLKYRWNDLCLGDWQFFGISNYMDDKSSIITHQTNLYNNHIHYAAIKEIISENKYFFRVCHNVAEFNFYNEMWPNNKTILFYNTEEWINVRNSGCIQFNWDDNKPIQIEQSTTTNYFKFDCLSFCSKENFIKEYTQLLAKFELLPENLDFVSIIYDEYMKLYFK